MKLDINNPKVEKTLIDFLLYDTAEVIKIIEEILKEIE